jgi:hypothetical protein
METLIKLEIGRIIRLQNKPAQKKKGFDDALIGLGVVFKPKKR